MSRMTERLIVAFFIVVTLLGCGSSKKSMTEVERFKADHRNTQTPHGSIDTSSATEGKDGTVEYETSDGSRWRTDMEKRADGSHGWKEPEKVTQ